MTTKKAIRYALLNLMEESGTSGKELAEAVGVSKQAVSAWRTGKSSIDIENVPAICDYFGITIAEFFEYTNEIEKRDKQENDVKRYQETMLVDVYKKLDETLRKPILNLVVHLSKEEKPENLIAAIGDISNIQQEIMKRLES